MLSLLSKLRSKQECIPVGCIPPAAAAVCWGGGVCLSACWDTPPGLGLDTPWVWAWRPPPRPDPSTSPLGVGLETAPARSLNHPRCGPGDPPPGQTPQLPTGCVPGDSPQPHPSTSPLGVGLETPHVDRILDIRF